LVCTAVVDDENELRVEEDEDVEVNNATAAAAAAAADDDDDDVDDDAEYFEDVNDSVPTLAELQHQIVLEIGDSRFNRVYSVLQVTP